MHTLEIAISSIPLFTSHTQGLTDPSSSQFEDLEEIQEELNRAHWLATTLEANIVR